MRGLRNGVAALIGVTVLLAMSGEAQTDRCTLLSPPVIAVTIPATMPTDRLLGQFTVQCSAGLPVRAALSTRGFLHGPLDLAYRLDSPEITFTGTGQPQIIAFSAHLTTSGAVGTMVLPAEYVDQPSLALAY